MEAAIGRFPIHDDKQGSELTFWQLMQYFSEKDMPSLSPSFSEEFRDFVSKCLKK